MLKTLHIENIAVIERADVEFSAGLSVLTGETGAGKSIIIDSLNAVLGNRVSRELVRSGAERASVTASFESAQAERWCADNEIDADDGEIILQRRISTDGKSTGRVNGVPVTASQLRELGALLLDIHGQNENLALLKEENQFHLLDGYDPDVAEALAAYECAYREWREKKKAYEEKQQASREYAQRLDMLHWQDKEISEANLKAGEDEALEAEIRKLSHAEKIVGSIEESYELLEGGGGSGLGVLPALSQVKKDLEDISRFDDALANAQKMVEEAYISLQEASYELRDYGESVEFSPARLDQLQSRMDVIYRLCKKYGATLGDVLAHQEKVERELSEIENYDEDIAALEKEIAVLEKELGKKAAALPELRRAAAKDLSAAIEEQLFALGMPKAQLAIRVEPAADYGPRGRDEVAMFFSANPGEAEKPRQRVASGGELSRIALAIKTVASSRDSSVPSMVFDEIDTGIGGRTAQMVAERIALVAQYKQVLCITHLPQIACMADAHLYISKRTEEGTTATQIRPLSERERISEIARMASGADMTTASLDNAREMVSHAKMKKDAFRREASS